MIPFLVTLYALIIRKFLKIKARPDPKGGQKLRPIDYKLQHLRAIVTHGAVQVSDLKEDLTKTESEKRDAVSRSAQAEVAETEAIEKLTREKSKEIADLETTKDKLMAAMRNAVDPRGLHPNEDVLRLAKDLESDYRHWSPSLY